MQLKQSCQILTSCLHSQFGITRSPPPNSGWGAIRAAQNIERIPTVDVRAHAKEGAQLGSTSHLCAHLTRAICVATLNCAHSPTMLRSVGTLTKAMWHFESGGEAAVKAPNYDVASSCLVCGVGFFDVGH